MSAPDPRADWVRDLYERLLRLYPKEFRRRFQKDLMAVFDARRREPRFAGARGGLRLVLFLLRDFAISMPLARGRHSTEGAGGMMKDLARDLLYAARMLVKNPTFTAAAVITLALGIGLNAATFSVVHGLLLRPLSGTEHPEELVQIYRKWPGMDYGSNSIPHYQDVRDGSGNVFESLAAWYFTPISLSADGRSERTMGMLVSANFFQTYGAVPALGRPFIPGEEDSAPGSHPVAVLGYGFWQTRFGGDPSVLGSTLILNGHPFEVVGVAPEDFRGPVSFAAIPIYVPLMMQREIDPGRDLIEARGNNMMSVVGRLRDGETVERAQEMMDVMLLRLREELPDSYGGQEGTTLVLQNEAGIHPTFRSAQVGMSSVIMVVVVLLLLIACVNVANLFLARARDRRREMGIRLSLGAGRRRIVQQLLTESLVFSTLAGVAGLGLAGLVTRFLGSFRLPLDGPWRFAVDLNETVLVFTLVVSVTAGLLFGMVPALQSARSDTAAAVRGGSIHRAGGSRPSRALVVLQMALSLLLLLSSGLFLRSLKGAMEIDPGFEAPGNLVMASVDPGLQGYDDARARAFFDRIVEDVEALPEVTRVGLSSSLPLGFTNSDRSVSIPGYEFTEGERRSLQYARVTEGYLETMGVSVEEGRTFRRTDDGSGGPVIIVNQRFADRFWPGESAVGKTVRTAGEERTVIGVVATGKYRSLGEDPTEFMFLPQRELFTTSMTLVARTPSDPQAVLGAIRAIVREVDPDLPVFDVRTMEDHMGIALLPARLGGTVLGLFGILGLALAAVGIYGVMAYSVSQRRRELGIRMALGADRHSVLRLVVGEGMRLAVMGTVLGLAAAAAAAQLVKGMLYNVSAWDPAAFAGVPLVLVAVALLAVYLPARRAAAVDPMRALKTE